MNTGAPKSFDIAGTLRIVLLAMVPGIAVTIRFLGLGVLLNIVVAALFALMFEALALWLRQERDRGSDMIPLARKAGRGGILQAGNTLPPPMNTLLDGSALITATLIALALPPFAPWWIILIACAAAILLGKHCYGGLGQNIFNPAMTGYALVLLAFPAQLAQWPALAEMRMQPLDGYTSATVLDTFKQNHAFTVADWWRSHAQFGDWGGYGWEWINLAFLGGGAVLLWRKIISWHIPVAMLAMLGLCAAAFYDNGSSASGGSPLFHWLSGATMLGAFFVATDPASAAGTILGRILYGASIGALVFAIRHAGHYADGVAFAVLGANAAALLLDRIDARALRELFKPAGGSIHGD